MFNFNSDLDIDVFLDKSKFNVHKNYEISNLKEKTRY